MKLFHWGLMLRYMVYGVLPLVAVFFLVERVIAPGASGAAFVVLAMILPFIAIGWLAYQHWRHRGKR